MKYTGWCQNDFSVQGYPRRTAGRRPSHRPRTPSASRCGAPPGVRKENIKTLYNFSIYNHTDYNKNVTWGDIVSSCMSYRRGKGPGTQC